MGRGQRWSVRSAWLCLALSLFAGGRHSHAGDWVLPDDRLGVRTAPVLLLTRADVQSELRLEPSQIAGAHSLIDDLTRRAFGLKGKSGAAVVAERRSIDESQAEWLTKNLSG